jgi:hypothetical protein
VCILDNPLFHVMYARELLLHVVPSPYITVCTLRIVCSQCNDLKHPLPGIIVKYRGTYDVYKKAFSTLDNPKQHDA